MLHDSALDSLFVTGDQSFCKKVKYSRRFRAIWTRKQHGDFDSFLGVMQDLSYSPNRLDSEADPRAMLIDKMGATIDTCIEVRAQIRLPAMPRMRSFVNTCSQQFLDRKASPTLSSSLSFRATGADVSSRPPHFSEAD